jgi:hypothetical protein
MFLPAVSVRDRFLSARRSGGAELLLVSPLIGPATVR